MRLSAEASHGDLAARPADAVHALADLAAADGADRDEWLTKAAHAAGASAVSVPVAREPRHAVVADTAELALTVYARAMTSMQQAIRARLDQAHRDAAAATAADIGS